MLPDWPVTVSVTISRTRGSSGSVPAPPSLELEEPSAEAPSDCPGASSSATVSLA